MSTSHIGQLPSNHVMLSGTGMGKDDLGAEIYGFFRIYPDGTTDPSTFKLPSGKALVVTDVDWNYNTGEKNRVQTFNIFMLMPENNIRNVIFASTVIGDEFGSGGASVSMTTGFVVSKMDRMIPNLDASGFLNDIILRGYIIDAPLDKKRDIKIKRERRHS